MKEIFIAPTIIVLRVVNRKSKPKKEERKNKSNGLDIL